MMINVDDDDDNDDDDNDGDEEHNEAFDNHHKPEIYKKLRLVLGKEKFHELSKRQRFCLRLTLAMAQWSIHLR